jgi:branched-chain amino acid aminotransferase
LDGISLHLPAGVYTTFRTYRRTMALDLEAHFQRLEESADILGHCLNLDRKKLRYVIRNILLGLSNTEHRLRISIGFVDDSPRIFVTVETLQPLPESEYENGASVILTEVQRETPKAKSTSFIRKADAARGNLLAGVNEALMVDEGGMVLEGLSSNFFAVKNGVVFTAGEGVLEGITRSLVIASIKELQIQITFRGININDMSTLDECFITSASRGVLPVVLVGDLQIGNGKPGQVTRAITGYFNYLIERKIEEI